MTPPLTLVGLRCAHQVDPLGVAPDRVRLSWLLDDDGRSRSPRASWIGRARLYIIALGLYEARLGGHRVGDAFLAPGWTDYRKGVLYQTHDVTGSVRQGENVLGALLADGRYSGFLGFDAKRAGGHYGAFPEFLAQRALRLADGTDQWVVTDGQWQARFAAIQHADLLMGECHDLSLEPHGWDLPGFDAKGWEQVHCRALRGRPLAADPGPPVRVTEQVAPSRIERDPAGRQIISQLEPA